MEQQPHQTGIFGYTTVKAALVESTNMDCSKSNGYAFEDSPETPKKLQMLAREEMKMRLLQDILADISICKIEGWDYKTYLLELEREIEKFL